MPPIRGEPTLTDLRMSKAMRLVLLNIAAGLAADRGLRPGQLGGFARVVRALEARHLISDGVITGRGRRIVDRIKPPPRAETHPLFDGRSSDEP